MLCLTASDFKLTNIRKYAVCKQRNDKRQCANQKNRGRMALHILINFFFSVSNKTIIRSSLSVFSKTFLWGQDQCRRGKLEPTVTPIHLKLCYFMYTSKLTKGSDKLFNVSRLHFFIFLTNILFIIRFVLIALHCL